MSLPDTIGGQTHPETEGPVFCQVLVAISKLGMDFFLDPPDLPRLESGSWALHGELNWGTGRPRKGPVGGWQESRCHGPFLGWAVDPQGPEEHPSTGLSCSSRAAARPSRGWRISRSTCGATRVRSRTCASTQAVRRPSATPATVPSTSAPTSTR